MAVDGTDRDAAVLGLVALSVAADSYRRAAAERHDLDVLETQAMSYLDRDGPMSQTHLARLLSLTSGGVTGVVDRLERSGTARRVADPGDRRRHRLELTDRGVAVLAESRRGLTRAFDGFDAQVLATLADALPRLAAGVTREAGTLGS